MSTTESTPTRSRVGRSLDTCTNLAYYFINRAMDRSQRYTLDNVAFTKTFNWWKNSTAREKGPRDTSRDWSAEEVIALLVEALQRGKVDLVAIRDERGALGVGDWGAVDSAASLALGLDTFQEREDRRVAMRDYAALVEKEQRREAVIKEEIRARRPPPGTRAKSGGKSVWDMVPTFRPVGVIKLKGKPRAKSVVLARLEVAKEQGVELLRGEEVGALSSCTISGLV